ncbi:predicted protein [Thalassiosira pseudonana CCMP1335]|uniref:Uncharacterized protein n=1 Tax=Thalassiosira pseudonana TaxID=35128 RepID=B8C6L4_THAPS|nr:predicted protein [Thalassiosira pseudonana CCMP1335]EED90591.1 predicted protein [Thalassiosira pseudonana CCMP1335]|eukprot:g1916.t1 g1916   contig11:342688-343788(+)
MTVPSNIIFVILLVATNTSTVAGGLAWGKFLGADWAVGEENIRKNLATSIKNTQIICSEDVENICLEGKSSRANQSAVSDWTRLGGYERHSIKHFEQVPIGFGDGADACLHKQYEQYESGSSKRLAPKCVEWLEKAEDKFETLAKREKGNDKREAFVVFATLFALSVSAAVGFMFGVLLKERDDLFSYHNRAENKKMFIIFGVAISIPVVVIIWASRRLFMLMTGAFFTGRAVQFFHQKKQDSAYSLVSGSDSGLVFAAIPVQMD